jgi:hypothetical protein
MPRVLIAIKTWVAGSVAGRNQSQRDTFLKDVPKFPDLFYRFFIGDGTPTGEDEYKVNKSFEDACPWHMGKNFNDPPFNYTPQEDEVVLHVPDNYVHASYKVRGALRWALDHDIDYCFVCDSDTYICLDRLMSSGFEQYDYVGRGADAGRSFCPDGGPGYWLSKKAMLCIVDQPVTFWADDGWIGYVLNDQYDIHLHHDFRYCHYVDDATRLTTEPNNGYPQKNNDIITAHCGGPPPLYPIPDAWWEIHKGLQ